MNFIDELLKDEKVEWKTIGDIIERYSEKAQYNKDIKIVYTISKDYGIIPSLEYWNDKEQKNNYQIYSEDTGNYNVIRENMFAYNPARLNIGSIDCLFNKEPGLLSPMYVIFKIDEKKIMAKYLLLYLKSSKVLQKIDSIKEPGARFRFDFKRWNKIEIPIPPIEAQEKIVKILDNFTKCVTELQAELQARNKQYNYYRDMLLSEDYLNKISEKLIKEFCPGGVEWKKLGDIGEFYGGITGKRKGDFQNGNAVFITYKNVYNNLSLKIDVEDRVKIYEGEKQRNLQYGDIIFTGSSEKLNECGISSVVTENPSENLYLNSFCFFLRLYNTGILLPDFSKYLFRSEKLRHQIIKTASGVTRFNVSKEMMKKIEIPIPPIETQEKIVKILDNFTKYVTELQAELQARNKQYEYYREKLLNFEK